MLSCKEAARLISDRLDRELPLGRRIALRLHLAMCSACRRYRNQVESLNRLYSRRAKRELSRVDFDSQSLSAEARERINSSLRQGPH